MGVVDEDRQVGWCEVADSVEGIECGMHCGVELVQSKMETAGDDGAVLGDEKGRCLVDGVWDWKDENEHVVRRGGVHGRDDSGFRGGEAECIWVKPCGVKGEMERQEGGRKECEEHGWGSVLGVVVGGLVEGGDGAATPTPIPAPTASFEDLQWHWGGAQPPLARSQPPKQASWSGTLVKRPVPRAYTQGKGVGINLSYQES